MTFFEIIGYIIIAIGCTFIILGVFSLYKHKDFYTRILSASLIDTAGFLTVSFGLMFLHNFSFFTLKIIIITALVLFLNPLATHIIARSAYISDTERRED